MLENGENHDKRVTEVIVDINREEEDRIGKQRC